MTFSYRLADQTRGSKAIRYRLDLMGASSLG